MTPLDFSGPGTLVRHEVTSKDLPRRAVDVWLPPDDGAGPDPAGRPVVYAHDGQNLFVPALAFAGVPWNMHLAALAAGAAAGVRAPVVVGIWNAGDDRYLEFLPPEPALEPTGTGAAHLALALSRGGAPRADAYLAMLVDEVIPAIEAAHGLTPQARDRIVLGSSMGGVVSLYAALVRPDVFSAAGCISTNFIVGGAPLVDWFAERLPGAGALRLWLDRGTEGLDAEYAPTQARMDAALRASGLVEGRDWIGRVYPGADHSEWSWAARVGDALTFLLSGRAQPDA